jgi:hypothetical protein
MKHPSNAVRLNDKATDALRRVETEWLSVLHKIEAAKRQLRAKQLSKNELIDLCAAGLVAGEELAATLNTFRQRVRGLPNGDRLLHVLAGGASSGEDLLAVLASAKEIGADSFELNAMTAIVKHVDSAARSGVSRKAAFARHAQSPQQAAKEVIRECWEAWQAKPRQYKSKAAFARAMLDKFPDTLKSNQVVERWAREWELRKT